MTDQYIGVTPEETLGISHGTLECSEIGRTREFFRQFLGIQTLRHAEPSFMTFLNTPEFYIACVEAGEQTGVQGRENRWELSLDSDGAVLDAHRAAIQLKDVWNIREVTPLSEQDGFAWFALQDLNGNWWGFSARGQDWFENAFEHARRVGP
jgi:catechol 2,3-dioxygenase-like lactoylglutathione lyase family enzyme